MRFKVPPALAVFALLSFAVAARAQEQPQDQKVIDDFVTTRGVSFDEPTHTSTAPKQTTHASTTHKGGTGSVASKGRGANSSGGSVASNKNSSSTTNGSKKNNASSGKGSEVAAQSDEGRSGAKNTGAQVVNASAVLRPIGLGYTVFMKDKAGGLLSVNPSQEFHSGDRIAVALEPNTEGYIYVFNAENDSDPVMLFPNVALEGGANAAHAHVRETYPADVNYAFEFDQTAAVEHLYVVVSRHPLEGVPTGDALAEFCGKKRDDCEWRPSAALWQRIKSVATDKHVVEAKNTQLAQLQKQPVQPASLQRGIKIKREDPAPAIVRVNDSPDADTLVTVIKLVHKSAPPTREAGARP